MIDWFRRLYLGKGDWGERIFLDEETHRQPMYILGRPGQGKSWLQANVALQAHELGEGVLVIDTKTGSLTRDIATRTTRPEDTIYIAPGLCIWPTQYDQSGEMHYWGINVLEYDRSIARNRHTLANQIANNAVEVFQRVGQLEGFMTQVEDKLEMSVRLAIAKPGSTLIDVRKILTDEAWRKKIQQEHTTLYEVAEFWQDFDDQKKTTPTQRYQAVSSTAPRVRRWTVSPMLNYTISQSKTTLRLREWLDAGKLILCDFGSELDERDRLAFGNLALAMATNAGFQRQRVREEDKRHWRFVLDEFHRLASASFGDLLNLGREQRIWPVMAHQTMGQLNHIKAGNNELFTSITGAGVQIQFNVGHEDRRYFQQTRTSEQAEEIGSLERFRARVEVQGSPADSGFPQVIEVDPLTEEENEDQLHRLIDGQRDRRYTTPEHIIHQANLKRYYKVEKGGTTKGNERPTKPKTTQPVSPRPVSQDQTPLDDRAGDGHTETARPVPPSRKRRPTEDPL